MDFECTECGSEYKFQVTACDSCGYDTVEQVRYTPDNTPGDPEGTWDEFEFIPETDFGDYPSYEEFDADPTYME